MADTPQDIIELTDIIEKGPGVPESQNSGAGVDLSFERELEDLFADTPGDQPGAASADGLPGLDDLHIPDSGDKAEGEGDIDLDGLDALLAEAEKSGPGGLDLPELPDDFLDQPTSGLDTSADEPFDAALAASAVGLSVAAASQGASGPAMEALNARLDLLEEKLTAMGGTLSESFKSMLDESLAAFKAGLPEAAPAPELDEAALASRVKDEVLAALPATPEAMTAAEVEAVVDARLESFKAELSASEPAPALDEEAVAGMVDARLEAFKAGLPEAAPAPELDEAALADRVKDEVLAALPAAPEAMTAAEVEAVVDARLESFKSELSASEPAPALDEEAVAGMVDARLEAFKAGLPEAAPALELDEAALADRVKDEVLAALPAPDLSGLVTGEQLEALRQELLDEVRKAVPAAAARIIREEIQALVQDMDSIG